MPRRILRLRKIQPTHVAAQNGHVDVLKLLRNAEVNLETPDKDGCTPAIMAAKNDHLKVLAAGCAAVGALARVAGSAAYNFA